MALSVSKILTDVSIILQDVTNVRWTQAELLEWLNAAQREIVGYKPNTSVKTVSVPTVPGTRQAAPADCISIIRLVRNMGVDGNTPGSAIRLVSHEIIDAQLPDWHSSPKSPVIKHYVFDDNNPKTYYVYPPSNGATMPEMVYCAYPVDATFGGNISIDDIFESALLNYILYRSYSKDAEYAMNKELAAGYYGAFTTLLTGKSAAEVAIDPNKNAAGNRGIV
jgi:hypothetical protein